MRRAVLQTGPVDGAGVPVEEISSLGQFGWQILGAATDWQDQLLSELTGQRERIARIYLKDGEGGLNLSMSPSQSEALMGFGAEPGGCSPAAPSTSTRIAGCASSALQNAGCTDGGTGGEMGGWVSTSGRPATSPPPPFLAADTTDRAKMINDLRALMGSAKSNSLVPPHDDRNDEFPDKLGEDAHHAGVLSARHLTHPRRPSHNGSNGA